MTNYRGFARVYDALMADAPYDSWAAYIDDVIGAGSDTTRTNSRKNFIVLDLACGTGNIALRLAKMGYDLIGVDASEDMLAEASRKAYDENLKILFLEQDMRELNLFGTIDAVVCVMDGMSYLLTEYDLLKAFKRVKLFLNPGGIFIFDMNTEYKFKEMLGENSFTAEADGASYEWDNHYDAAKGINEYRVTFTQTCGESFVEVHHQRAYPVNHICKLLKKAGFNNVEVRDGYSDATPSDECIRAVFIAK